MSSFSKQVGSYQVSNEYTQLQVVKAKVTVKEKTVNGQLVKTKIFQEINKAKTDVLTVRLTSSDLGQQLTFCFQRGGNEEDAKDPTSRVLATFTMKKNFELTMVCNQEFNAINSYTYKPLLTAFPGIEAGSVSDVFSQWLCTDEFVEHLKIVSAKKGYTPALVKMLFLFIAYQQERYSKFVELGEYSKTMEIDLDRVVAIFKEYISGFSEDFSVHLKKHYNVSQFTLSAAATPAIESIQVTPSTPDV